MARKAADEDLDALDLEEDFEAEEEEEEKAQKKGKGKSKKDDKPKGIGAREMAEHLGAEPKTFRAWLRRLMEAGELPELADNHEHKQRYSFGSSVNSNLAKKITKLWNETSHERGEGLKKANEAKKKSGGSKKKSTTKKKKSS